MSLGYKQCPHCDEGQAEALIAIDGKIEWYCNCCSASWQEDVEEAAEIRMFNQDWVHGYNRYGEE